MNINILNIGLWHSRCENCGIECDPSEKEHKTNLGQEEVRKEPGCGVTYTHVTTYYIGLEERIKIMRPDLIFLNPMERANAAFN